MANDMDRELFVTQAYEKVSNKEFINADDVEQYLLDEEYDDGEDRTGYFFGEQCPLPLWEKIKTIKVNLRSRSVDASIMFSKKVSERAGSLRRMDKQGVKVDPALLDQAYRNLVNDGERLDQGERNRVSISQTHITLIN